MSDELGRYRAQFDWPASRESAERWAQYKGCDLTIVSEDGGPRGCMQIALEGDLVDVWSAAREYDKDGAAAYVKSLDQEEETA